MADAVAPPRPPPASDVRPVVCCWPGDANRPAAAELRRLLTSVPAAARVFVPDRVSSTGTPSALSAGELARCSVPPGEPAEGLAAFLNAVAQSSPRADLILVAGASGPLPDGWLAGLQDAAYADDAVAAASALSIDPARPVLDEAPVDGATGGAEPRRAPRPSGSPPRVLGVSPSATWIRRSALDLAGAFDEAFAHPATVLADFSARALRHGLACVLADGVIVERTDAGLATSPRTERDLLWERHPWLRAAWEDLEAIEEGPLRRSLIAARAAQRGLSVTVDARALGPGVGGTQTYVGSLVLSLARADAITVRAVLAHDAPGSVREAFAQAGAEVISYEQAAAGISRTDVVHRPQQVFTSHDLRLLHMLGERLVISHMDLIAFRNPTYHGSVEDWRAYRRTTRLALAAADRVIFFSDHARRDAIGEQLATPERSTVAGIGVSPGDAAAPSQQPPAMPAGRRFLLALGADYVHKNRPFAMQLVDELRRRHGWDGLLVLAGPHVMHGSSADAEAALLRDRPELTRHVVDLGPISEAEKHWLLRHAEAHLCPSNYEGFGLAPLEAAAAARPCIYAPWTSLAEIIDPAAATIVPWDVRASAGPAAALLTPGEPRDRHLALLAQALTRFTWPAVLPHLVSAYNDAVASPYRASAPRAWEQLKREEQITAIDEARLDLQRRVAHGQPLIDRSAPLLTQAQRRGLMRVASRRWLRAPLLAPFGLLGVDDREPPGGGPASPGRQGPVAP